MKLTRSSDVERSFWNVDSVQHGDRMHCSDSYEKGYEKASVIRLLIIFICIDSCMSANRGGWIDTVTYRRPSMPANDCLKMLMFIAPYTSPFHVKILGTGSPMAITRRTTMGVYGSLRIYYTVNCLFVKAQSSTHMALGQDRAR